MYILFILGNNYLKKEVFSLINKVEICGVNTAKLPVLSNEEKNELLKKIKNGDNNARQEFINGNLKLVLSVIKRFRCKSDNADDNLLFFLHSDTIVSYSSLLNI